MMSWVTMPLFKSKPDPHFVPYKPTRTARGLEREEENKVLKIKTLVFGSIFQRRRSVTVTGVLSLPLDAQATVPLAPTHSIFWSTEEEKH